MANTKSDFPVILESERLLLNEISWDDLQAVHQLNSCPEVDEFNTLGIPKNTDETRQLLAPTIAEQKLEDRKTYIWKILLKTNNDFIGVAGFTLSRNKFRLGEIYYKLLPTYWGKGYATETAQILVRAGFGHFQLHKVEAGVATENYRSIRVLEKVGMSREGRRRKILPIRGKWVDNYHYAIVEDDPRDY